MLNKKTTHLTTSHKMNQLAVFNLVALVTVIVSSTVSFIEKEFIHGLFLIFMGSLALINILVLMKTKRLLRAEYITIILLALVLYYLTATGGVGETGALWCYVFPLISYFILGCKKGSWAMAFFLATIAIIINIPIVSDLPITVYSLDFKIRFIGTLLVVGLLSHYYELLREKSISSLIELSKELDHQARTDPLTGLPNRMDIMERINLEHSRSQRYGKEYSIIMVDIDYFKKINDTFGHAEGDRALHFFATQLQVHIRTYDTAARLGGEEFLILLPETQLKQAVDIAERIRTSLAQKKVQLKQNQITLSASFGVYSPSIDDTIEMAVKAADHRLYEAKRTGRNRVVFQMTEAPI